MARADLFGPIVAGHKLVEGGWTETHRRSANPHALVVYPGIPDPTWTDAYGQTRMPSEMLTEHLWNVMGFLRLKRPFLYNMVPFYKAARNELRKRGIL